MTRLARYASTFEDGTTLVDAATFRDLARGEDCALETWSDGATYCTPAATDLVYADAACTHAIARRAPAPAAPVAYAREPFVTISGPRTSRLHALAGPVAVTGAYYTLAAGTCSPHAISDAATFAELAADTLTAGAFVRVRMLVDPEPPPGDGLQVLRLHGDDGLVAPFAFHDVTLALACLATGAANAAAAPCTPIHAAPRAYFNDPQCELPTVAASDVLAADAIASVAADGATCPRYFAISGAQTTILYDGTPDHCVAATAATGTYYEAGPELGLAAVTRTALPGGPRFAPIALAAPALGLRDTFVHDAALAFDCTPSAGRCVPATAGELATIYTDAGCTAAYDVIYAPAVDCGAHATHVATDAGYVAIGAPYTGPAFERSTAEICVAAQPRPGRALHERGALVAPGALGAVTRAVLP